MSLVDDRSGDPALGPVLEGLALWSERNPGHVPIILLFELKNDYGFLDPALRDFDAAALDRLDAALRSGLGRRLVEPNQAFAILNDPAADAASIRSSLAMGCIVRTRADADLSLGGLEAALASGAQIISTDFPPGAPDPGGYEAALPGGKTLDAGGGTTAREPL